MAGFFEDQMRSDTTSLVFGAGHRLLQPGTLNEPSKDKARLLSAIGMHFEAWRQRHAT